MKNRLGLGPVALLVVSVLMTFMSTDARAAVTKTVQEVIVTNSAQVPVPVIVGGTVGVDVLSAPMMVSPGILMRGCYYTSGNGCEQSSPAPTGGYIWGLEFYVRAAGQGQCIITAFIRDLLIAQYVFWTTRDSNGATIATSDPFNRLVLPRVIPYAFDDVVKVQIGGTACNAGLNFLVDEAY